MITLDTKQLKLRAGEYRYPVNVTDCGDSLRLNFAYNKSLLLEIKSMEGARWHPADCDCRFCSQLGGKCWTIKKSVHNQFQLSYLAAKTPEESPYFRYDQPLPVSNSIILRFNKSLGKEVSPYAHQYETIAHILVRKQCIIAEEMGLGKTLSLLLAVEQIKPQLFWYIAPKGVIRAIERELYIWDFPPQFRPTLMTYEKLVKVMADWKSGQKAPQVVCFDESARLKTPTSQRSQAAAALADGVRADWGDDAYVVLMTGTPAPKSPADWYWQCRTARPGFLKEGDIFKFRNTLGIIVQQESITGGVYPQLVTWRDDEKKCNICGKPKDDANHNSSEAAMFGSSSIKPHDYEPSRNEITRLYRRLQGLVIVKFKKDCLDLPEKRYRQIELKPTPSILRAASVIARSSKTVIQGLTLLRELSDGFQYIEKIVGEDTCPRCHGIKQTIEKMEVLETCPNCKSETNAFGKCLNHFPKYIEQLISCPHCGGKGKVPKYDRTTKEVPTPKEGALEDILDEHDDVGRLVVYAGFTASIDRVVKVCHANGWATIRVDSRGWQSTTDKNQSISIDPLELFQNKTSEHLEKYPRVVFVAHPLSGGEGLTLTASPSIVYWSNDFNGNARSQSEERIHRPGMDVNRGATIIDLFHLPSDRKVYDNLKAKRELELMSLGELSESFEEAKGEPAER